MKKLCTFCRRSRSFVVLLLSACTGIVHAQSIGLADCRAIEDRLERFDCYEMLEPETPGATGNTETSGKDEVEPAGEEPSLLRRLLPFGLGEAAQEDPENSAGAPPDQPAASIEGDMDAFGSPAEVQARLEQGSEGRVELVDTVASLEMFGHKRWRITLSNGQVWTQMLSETFNLRQGDEVRISPVDRGKYYRLSSPELAGYIQVRRLQ